MASSSPAEMPKLRIYGMGSSTCTQRALISAFENDANFTLSLVDLRKGEHKQAAHLERQPFGVIPALEDDSFTVYESRAIARYINDTRGRRLTPTQPQPLAIMEQWISLEQGTITPEISGIVAQRIFAPVFGGRTDESAVAKHVEKVSYSLNVMEKQLAKYPYLAGDRFTLADAFYMPYFHHLLSTPERTLIETRPNITAWWQRISSRPSWIRTQELNEFNKKIST